ncbi:MAG: T9SS type B sorting domain-containing protein [Saprospiraceae bacterium]|nr:T9SS type B sorting domain-containing protein [Saprospiraceae bacterium]
MRLPLLGLMLMMAIGLFAQPGNDECIDAIELTNIANWCSDPAEFGTAGSSISVQDQPRCFGAGDGDVWFRFFSISTNLNIRVIGDIVDIYGVTEFSKGTLREPRLALYGGSCDALTLLTCDQDDGDHISEIYAENVVPNSEYYLRISGASPGTFQLCISSFNLVPEPNSDCGSGVVLCDKSSFFVPNISGDGEDGNEVNTSCLTSEDNSAWYKWVAGKSGSLGFVITPNNPGDDIDFAVYELPNGISDCGDKIELRCMASGANGNVEIFGGFVADPFVEWDECTGPTGLRIGDPDATEAPGCNTGVDNNFVSAIELVEGRAYALVVLNFSASGHGFSLDFGGTGEFLGPQADFSTDDPDGTICFNEPVFFFDESTFGDLAITQWDWNFGENAVPQTASGIGPHQVRYTGGGIKSIALTVESETGCLVTNIGTLIVEEPFNIKADVVHQSCPEVIDGTIALDIESGSAVTSILWSNGQTGRVISELMPGLYEATISNFNGCDTLLQFEVEAPLPLEINNIITRPSCGGNDDGSIALEVEGQAPPFLFDFDDGNGFRLNNTRSGLVAGIYDVTIQDNSGCTTEVSVLLGEINVELDPTYSPTRPPTCFGFNDGQIEVRVVGGDLGYAYDWNVDGNYVPDSIYTPVGAGTMLLRIRDQANCVGFLAFEVEQPDELQVFLDTVNISCFAAADGSIEPTVTGGTEAYDFTWSNGTKDRVAVALDVGEYSVTVRDQNGCQTTANAFVAEPPLLDVLIDSTRDVLCFGDRSGQVFVSANGGNAPFSIAVDGGNFLDERNFTGLAAGAHIITVRDGRGCTIDRSFQILQPEPLIVEAGQDTTIDIGFVAQLLATHEPLGKPVSYQWSPPTDCNCPVPQVKPVRTTTYEVTILDDDGCSVSDSVTVFVFLNRPVFIPNSITPNEDGFNDRLAVYGGNAVAQNGVKKLQIFDRWGEMVWEGKNLPLNDETVGWDGTYRGRPLNPGVFVYLAEVQFLDDSILTFEGNITLVR